ncbi:Cu2+-exporting ATPase [Cognatiyoonia koreensis]|uniref:Cu2+-exporting ATPase n=1 Tax=Cognatiyoonia koreensis TaxID=364200 RepID=A0A1I0RP35_9RHOB|nr:heavy metal translocating P-type ATPase [Cognatiyoonia koreensis]SEW43001.1 Cu2+-exporting ATPase [Cognatiyoonia koreensis]
MSDAAFCPACVGLPGTSLKNATKADHHTHQISLPGIHCVACINGVEQTLLQCPGVSSARVNLSLKRVSVTADRSTTPESLIDALELAGFEARALDGSLLGAEKDTVGRTLLTRIAVAGFAMMNVMLLSVAVWSGAVGATLTLFHLISAAIALPALLFSAQPFFLNAMAALRGRRLNMDVPISLAIILAGGMSTYEALVGGEHAYFDAALSLTFFLLLGRYLDHRSRAAAVSAAAQLAALETPRVQRVSDGVKELVDFAELNVGDTVIVLPGGRIPVDGTVVEGSGLLDRSMLTGESDLIAIDAGDCVTAGEINTDGLLQIRASTVGEDTTLRRMVSMVDEAESVRNKYNAIADRAAQVYAPVVHLLSFFAFLGWLYATGDARLAINIAIAVLIITCPCALGLAVPAVSTTAAGRLFRSGLLVKDGTALERIAEVDTVVFDKTGTLTQPRLADSGIALTDSEKEIICGLASSSTHPVARAIKVGLPTTNAAKIDNIKEQPGKGISGEFEGITVQLGAMAWLGQGSGTGFQFGENPPKQIEVGGMLRDGALALIDGWKALGLEIHLVSGDSEAATQSVADALNIKEWRAETHPADKIAYVTALSESGKKVLMVGDGMNDTGALAAAFASISPASAVDASRAASDIVLLHDTLEPLIELPVVARSAKRRIIENFSIAAGYNAIAIPVALAGFATPLLAAIAMSASSIMVVLNALRLKGTS